MSSRADWLDRSERRRSRSRTALNLLAIPRARPVARRRRRSGFMTHGTPYRAPAAYANGINPECEAAAAPDGPAHCNVTFQGNRRRTACQWRSIELLVDVSGFMPQAMRIFATLSPGGRLVRSNTGRRSVHSDPAGA
jgi:hypothetical protein